MGTQHFCLISFLTSQNAFSLSSVMVACMVPPILHPMNQHKYGMEKDMDGFWKKINGLGDIIDKLTTTEAKLSRSCSWKMLTKQWHLSGRHLLLPSSPTVASDFPGFNSNLGSGPSSRTCKNFQSIFPETLTNPNFIAIFFKEEAVPAELEGSKWISWEDFLAGGQTRRYIRQTKIEKFGLVCKWKNEWKNGNWHGGWSSHHTEPYKPTGIIRLKPASCIGLVTFNERQSNFGLGQPTGT
ncbi:hypothetical protein BT96DRAFT_933100 [Gymnopus androsaceus JB14]|uniref:Uncharacterized protein n=1 Tax=Gymnopus androsaceus JB14 TaxID=1447944 RepID=A0A6A4IG95_9AGAR|nr:hypothetical protein BT96DRAFT_933100 [Gymnopus androsaceus JB14]